MMVCQMKVPLIIAAALALGLSSADEAKSASTRVFRAERHSRGDVGVRRIQPVDDAAWLWHPSYAKEVSEAPERYFRFRRAFDSTGGVARVDVSADERFVLLLDGAVVGRGPNRGSVANWTYQTYDLELPPGAHVVEAVVWRIGESAPLAQLSHRGGFILKAEGAFDGLLTTGKAEWEVGELKGTSGDSSLERAGAWGLGSPFTVTGTGLLGEQPGEWAKAVVVRGALPPSERTAFGYGLRVRGWLLYPSSLPDQTEIRRAPGSVKTGGVEPGRPFTVPPKTKREILWDLEDYYCAYPLLATRGGKGARVTWAWCEAMRTDKGRKAHNRADWKGLVFNGFTDRFLPDGRDGAVFSTPWWRCGRWVKIVVETADEPLEVTDFAILESRYPVEDESAFESDDATIPAIRRICRRGMQMCAHEMLFDCPYYEQQMYPGDTRVQLRILAAMSGDDRLVRRAIELYDYARRDNGMIPMNWPTRNEQESVTYSMCQVMMYGDYVREHGDRAWLEERVPGMRNTLDGISRHEDGEGLLVNLPGWSFIDWVPEWRDGIAPDGHAAPPSAVNNLYWAMTLRNAAEVERALGDEARAAIWEGKAARTFAAVERRFWDESRGMFADTVRHDRYSEHAQCLALLTGLLPQKRAERVFDGLVSAPDLARCTVYFSYYLFDAYFRFGRGDLFLKRLDLWRDYVARDAKTALEMPETEECDSRSDCHAWGSHPLAFMQRGLAGVQSAAPFYARVRVAPSPGPLSFIRSKTPHPKGFVETDLRFDGAKVSGSVTLPAGVEGDFVWRGRTVPLSSGRNALSLTD